MWQSMTTSFFGVEAIAAAVAWPLPAPELGTISGLMKEPPLLNLSAREALADKIRCQDKKNQNQRGGPSQDYMIGKWHDGEVVNENCERSGGLQEIRHDRGKPANSY